MYGQERKKSRNMTMILDIIHIITGVMIVILGVLAFLKPESNMALFPLIFFLAASLNMVNGVYGLHQSGRNGKKKAVSIGGIIMAALLYIVAIASAVSIWWR